MSTASAWAWAMAPPMLPVVSIAMMMSALAGKPVRSSVFAIVMDSPAWSVSLTSGGWKWSGGASSACDGSAVNALHATRARMATGRAIARRRWLMLDSMSLSLLVYSFGWIDSPAQQ